TSGQSATRRWLLVPLPFVDHRKLASTTRCSWPVCARRSPRINISPVVTTRTVSRPQLVCGPSPASTRVGLFASLLLAASLPRHGVFDVGGVPHGFLGSVFSRWARSEQPPHHAPSVERGRCRADPRVRRGHRSRVAHH